MKFSIYRVWGLAFWVFAILGWFRGSGCLGSLELLEGLGIWAGFGDLRVLGLGPRSKQRHRRP